MTLFHIALGSNTPFMGTTSSAILRAAFDALDQAGPKIVAKSQLYSTPCFPPGAGADYVNAAATLGFDGSAQALLDVLHGVEHDFDRQRQGRWASRTLDLDLLTDADRVIPSHATFDAWAKLPLELQSKRAPKELILPHPRIQDRAFVLVPLAEIAPDWLHPVFEKTVTEMRDALPQAEIDAVQVLQGAKSPISSCK